MRAQEHADRRPRAKAHPYTWPFRALIFLTSVAFIGLLLSLIIEWIGITFWWRDEGALHSYRMLRTELGYLNADFARSVYGASPLRVALKVSEWTYRLTGMQALVDWLSTPPAGVPAPVASGMQDTLAHASAYLQAAAYITQLYGVRLAVAVLSLHAFALFALVALVDGLVQRDLRKFGGGLESAYFFHRLLPFLTPTLWVAIIIYLSLPFSLHPNWIFLPAFALFAVILAKLADTFKKYL